MLNIEDCMKTKILLDEINEAYPYMSMPASMDLTVHTHGCEYCADVRERLEAYRGLELDKTVYIFMRRNWGTLSPVGFLWFIPLYLRYCISLQWDDAEELIYFLVYSFDPLPESEDSSFIRLSLLSVKQIKCLIYFLEWCDENENYYESEVDTIKAFNFLHRLLMLKSS